jgi:hypothetical protein
VPAQWHDKRNDKREHECNKQRDSHHDLDPAT